MVIVYPLQRREDPHSELGWAAAIYELEERVQVEAAVGGQRRRALLGEAGRWWLRRRFRATLERFTERFSMHPAGKTCAAADANLMTTPTGGLK